MELSRILVGVDGSPAASAALRWAAAAVAGGGEVVALHATRPALIAQAAIAATTGLGVFRDSEGPEEDARRALDVWCEPLRAAGVPYRAVVADDEPVHALLDRARQEEVDVIVIGHDRSTGFVDRLFDHLDEDLLDRARRPVVIVPTV